MTDICTHMMTVEYADQPDAAGRRIVHLVCPTCGATSDVLTDKTDEQLAAEVAAAEEAT